MQSKRWPSRFVASLASPWRSRDTSCVLLILALIVFAKNFWLDEDAHIPFRSLAQLQAGNGAVWNLGERVQVYTSTAWYWLLAAVNLLLHNVLATAVVVTVLLFVTLLALARRIYGDTPALWFLLVAFLLSKGFFDFTSSGHENILAYTVLLALYAAYRQSVSAQRTADSGQKAEGGHPPSAIANRKSQIANPLLIALLTGLVPVVRHDLSLLCLPPFAWLLWRERHHWRREVVLIALAGLPLLLWTIASLVYYGLPLPSTAYSKVLKHGFGASIILKMGLDYFYCNGRHDPLTMLIIAVAPVVAFWKLQSWQRAFALGVVLYCLYLCKIGGDYFAGRFLSVPFLVAALLAADWLQTFRMVGTRSTASLAVRKDGDAVERVPTRFRPRAVACIALVATAAYLWLIPATPLLTPWTYGRDLNTPERLAAYIKEQFVIGTQDSRASSYSTTLAAWWRNEQRAPCALEFFRRDGESMRSSSDTVVVRGPVGVTGYYAGLKVHIVDEVGITDPLLGHLPSVWLFTPGQFIRDRPGGYLEHLRDGVTPIQDAQLNRYYQKIEQITRSRDLFSLPRLKTIVAFNLGCYESLLDGYRHRVVESHSLNQALRWTHQSAD